MSTSAGTREERSIRIFVSSTFRDMAEEREVLTKRVFPEIRRLCEERGVAFSDVDLRWGVTDEQAAEGEVLPICLREVDRCRPFFIGLLGERYGWVPEEIPDDLVEREPWLAEHGGRSVTELEVLHGVLRDPEAASHASFYLRDPAYLESLPANQRLQFEESGTDRPGDNGRAKLNGLKQRIRESGVAVRDGYRDPEELARLVRDDFTALIDRLYPEGSGQDPLDAEALQHEAYARRRSNVYLERPGCFEALDAFVDDPARGAIAVLGESGAGKSALLSAWALRRRARHSDALVLIHFIGSSRQSADPDTMLRRLNRELASWAGVEENEEATEAEALRAEFARLLHAGGERGRVVLVLDGLNQLEDRNAAHELAWLPPRIPDGVRLAVSTLPGRTHDALGRRGWLEDALRVDPLGHSERVQLIDDYLAYHGKAIDQSRTELIAELPQCANPLYLRTLLDELRAWGEHETLDARLDALLDAPTLNHLFEVILSRYEADYEDPREGLVGEAMSLIWAARNGLDESELLELLGSGDEPLPQAAWAPLYFASGELLVERGGLLDFAHDSFRKAVEKRYLGSEERRRKVHGRLAAYMRTRGPVAPRALEETARQLAGAAQWEELAALLGEQEWFVAQWEHDPLEVAALWAQIEAQSELRAADVYTVAAKPDSGPGAVPFALGASTLLIHLGAAGAAQSILEPLRGLAEGTGDLDLLQRVLGRQAGIHHARGELDRAMELRLEQERICRELGDSSSLGASLGSQALIHQNRGELDRAMELRLEQERICRELGDLAGVGMSLGNQALIHQNRGELDRAMELMLEQEKICRELRDLAGLQTSLGNQALVHYSRGELDRAMELHLEKERICRELRDLAGLQTSLGNQALIHLDRGELDRALELLLEQEKICRTLRDLGSLQLSLGNQALIHMDRGELDRAMELLREQERICRHLGNPEGLALSLTNQGVILRGSGDPAAAQATLEKALGVARAAGLSALVSDVTQRASGGEGGALSLSPALSRADDTRGGQEEESPASPPSPSARHGRLAHFSEQLLRPFAIAAPIAILALAMLGDADFGEAIAAALLVWAVFVVLAVRRSSRRAREDFFASYAESRALAQREEAQLPPVPPLLRMGDRRFAERVMTGTLPGGLHGALSFYTYENHRERDNRDPKVDAHRFTTVVHWLPEVPDRVRELYCEPRRSKGAVTGSDGSGEMRLLRLESMALDKRYRIRFGPDDDENWIHQLYAPTFIVWLSEGPPREFGFQLSEGFLCAFVPGHVESAAELDALCDAAAAVGRRLADEVAE